MTDVPCDIAAERAVLGACLLAADAVADARTAGLGAGAFHRPAHASIWAAIETVHDRGATPDPLLVGDALGDTLRRVGGLPYLHGLAAEVPTTANVGHYARAVLASWRRRTRWELALRLRDAATDPGRDIADIDNLLREHLHAASYDTDDATPSSWAPTDLAALIAAIDAGENTTPRPTVLTRRDGAGLLYPGAVHSVAGEPSSGKTWIAVIGAAQEITASRPVVYIDFEDRAETLVGRLRALGVPGDAIAAHLRYIRPDKAVDPAGHALLVDACRGALLAVIDGVTEAMTTHGLSLSDNEDVARWLDLLPRRLADLGPAVLQIDHVVKRAEDRGRYAIGGQHKLAGITGAAYTVVVSKPFARGQLGRLKVVTAKDRHGEVGPAGTTVADVVLDARDAGQTFGWLDVPTIETAPDGSFRPTALMERVSRWLEGNPGTSQRVISERVKGRAEYVRQALDVLVREGWVRSETKGSGQAYHVVNSYRESEDGHDEDGDGDA